MSVFIYGTLLDDVLRSRLLGRDVAGQPATLHGYVVLEHKTSPLPAIVAQEGGVTSGLLLNDLTDEEIAKLDAYELPFDYNPVRCKVDVSGAARDAQVYLPGATVDVSDRTWSLARWQDQSGPLTREMAIEIGSFDPPLEGDALVRQWHMIAVRANARLRARQDHKPAHIRHMPQAGECEIHPDVDLSGDFFRLAKMQVSHRTFKGEIAGPLLREVLVGADAAMVLPYDPKTDLVVLVEQIRMGPLMRGDQNPWALEPVAGIVDGGETPEQAALRESEEEAGLHDVQLEKMFSFYPSTGNATDYFYCYLGLCDLPKVKTYTGGLADEAEDLRLHVIAFDDAMALIDSGEAENAALITMLLWLARNRDRLRSTA